jgi:hypothetical protein
MAVSGSYNAHRAACGYTSLNLRVDGFSDMPRVETVHHVQVPNRRYLYLAMLCGIVAGIALGLWFVFRLIRLPSGYVAPYTGLAILLCAALLGVLAICSLPFRRTRVIALFFLCTSLLTLTTYIVGWRVLLKLGRIPWDPPLIQLVQGQHNTVVIRFKDSVTQEQADNFVSSKLSFLPNWCDSLTPLSGGEPKGVELSISDEYYRGANDQMGRKMLAKDVSAFIVAIRRDHRVSSVEVESRP